MKRYLKKLRLLWSRVDGPTAVEYAVMLALLVLVASASMQTLGCRTYFTFQRVAAKLPTK